jgi:hypothetical protein
VTRTAESDSIAGAFADLIDHGARVGREMFEALMGDPIERAREMATQSATLATAAGRQIRGCGCDIPPPCWMPERLGDLTSHVCPGATAKVRLRITNCGMSPRDVTVTAGGPQGSLVTIDPPSIAIEPFGSGSVSATVNAPDQACEPLGVQLWVHGCRDHLLRWTVDISRHGCSCTHEIEVEDCPDLIHHWYDHFYCERPCPADAERSHA